ncbi:hypothetical protein [Bacillus chungangensis]|uniref:Paraquat-inducible protein B n=1 Tax=Bacillus chungangensis TaxID=587633 RepID=A0ABT9WTF2_9BACI|nr:hypothetical protein [Bacillus chungangensis]MDQ0176557.1 paraquat-inducible protein B [Bacillus chungangensis]
MNEVMFQKLFQQIQTLEKNMKQELNSIEEKMETKLRNIEVNMATKQELLSIEENMATKQELQSIEENMATKQELQSIEEKLNVIYKQVAENTEQINELTSSQKRQEKSLQILALRSIEQEGVIRELKYAK